MARGRVWVIGAIACSACDPPKPMTVIHADDAGPAAPSSAPVVASTSAAPTAATSADVACIDDKECGWDDPCFAKRCLGGGKTMATCEESALKPGKCRCADRACTLQPNTWPAPIAGCKADADCVLDRGAATCRPGPGKAPLGIHVEGPLCHCDKGQCAYEWIGPVACKTKDDCSFARDPVRPVSASVIPRIKGFKPCVDASFDSLCRGGICEIAYFGC